MSPRPLILLALALAACSRPPDSLPVPAQYTLPPGPEPPAAPLPFARPLLAMADADIDQHIVREILPAAPGDPARWTQSNPALRFLIQDPANLRLFVKFFLPANTLAKTGPVTLAFSVDGKPFHRHVVTTPGNHELDAALPAGLLPAGQPFTLSFTVDPPYRAQPADPPLGVLLFAAGFRSPQ